MTKRNQCYSCFEGDTFQYHGMTHNYVAEVSKYNNKTYEGEIVECVNCERTVQYKHNGGSFKEVLI